VKFAGEEQTRWARTGDENADRFHIARQIRHRSHRME
jgi:hypothetical protein